MALEQLAHLVHRSLGGFLGAALSVSEESTRGFRVLNLSNREANLPPPGYAHRHSAYHGTLALVGVSYAVESDTPPNARWVGRFEHNLLRACLQKLAKTKLASKMGNSYAAACPKHSWTAAKLDRHKIVTAPLHPAARRALFLHQDC